MTWNDFHFKWRVAVFTTKVAHVGYYDHDDERRAAEEFDTKARELLGEDASGGRLKNGKKNTRVIRRLNFPRPEERERYDAAIAKLPSNNKCNAGDPVVWGESAGDGFECDRCANEMYERQDDENVQEGQIGYLCRTHYMQRWSGIALFKSVRPYKKKKK